MQKEKVLENVASLNVTPPRPCSSNIIRPHWSFLLNLVIKFSLSWESVCQISAWSENKWLNYKSLKIEIQKAITDTTFVWAPVVL